MSMRCAILTLCCGLIGVKFCPSPAYAGQVEILLSAERETYTVGEPVRLILSVKNAGDTPIFGFPFLQPYLPDDLRSAALSYCRSGETCEEFLGRIPGAERMDMALVPMRIDPGREVRSTFVVALNPLNRRLVLETPGEYEFRWVSRGLHAVEGVTPRTQGIERSVSAHVSAQPVPPSEVEAFEFYAAHGLAQLAQYEPQYVVIDASTLQAGQEMLVRHAHSIYAGAIVRGMISVLGSLERRGKASIDDTALLVRLRKQESDVGPQR